MEQLFLADVESLAFKSMSACRTLATSNVLASERLRLGCFGNLVCIENEHSLREMLRLIAEVRNERLPNEFLFNQAIMQPQCRVAVRTQRFFLELPRCLRGRRVFGDQCSSCRGSVTFILIYLFVYLFRCTTGLRLTGRIRNGKQQTTR